jgi:hypothetical protein
MTEWPVGATVFMNDMRRQLRLGTAHYFSPIFIRRWVIDRYTPYFWKFIYIGLRGAADIVNLIKFLN